MEEIPGGRSLAFAHIRKIKYEGAAIAYQLRLRIGIRVEVIGENPGRYLGTQVNVFGNMLEELSKRFNSEIISEELESDYKDIYYYQKMSKILTDQAPYRYTIDFFIVRERCEDLEKIIDDYSNDQDKIFGKIELKPIIPYVKKLITNKYNVSIFDNVIIPCDKLQDAIPLTPERSGQEI